jgi:hypothetical protein
LYRGLSNQERARWQSFSSIDEGYLRLSSSRKDRSANLRGQSKSLCRRIRYFRGGSLGQSESLYRSIRNLCGGSLGQDGCDVKSTSRLNRGKRQNIGPGRNAGCKIFCDADCFRGRWEKRCLDLNGSFCASESDYQGIRSCLRRQLAGLCAEEAKDVGFGYC